MSKKPTPQSSVPQPPRKRSSEHPVSVSAPAPGEQTPTAPEPPAAQEPQEAQQAQPETAPVEEPPQERPKKKPRRRGPLRSHEEWQRAIDQAVRKQRAAHEKARQRDTDLENLLRDARTQAPAPLVEAWRLVALGGEQDQDEQEEDR